MNTISILRKLAKNDYWQSIFSLSKEHNISLFDNNTNFSEIQFTFLKYLNFYSNLFTDIALNEVNEIVLTNDIFEDSYMYWKNKKDKKAINKINKDKQDSSNVIGSKWIFKSKETK